MICGTSKEQSMRVRASNLCLLSAALASLILGGGTAFAQAPATQQPPPPPRASSGPHEGLGIQLGGGPVFSTFTDTAGLNFDAKAGWLVGLLMGGNRGGVLGFEADALYGKKAASLNIPVLGKVDFEQQVVHVPVMLKVNAGSGNVNGLSFFGVGGGFFDWQFDSKQGNNPSKNTDGFEVGWVVGGGVELLRFSVQARIMRGLKEIGKDLLSAQDSKSQGFVVLFAFRLN
jgi:hypothetical protein